MSEAELGSIDELRAVLELLGRTPSPDAARFSELDHGLQCAFELSLRAPSDLVLHVAGLVHDVGHHFGGDDAHGNLGAHAVRPVLGERVAALVAAHVPAKRFLVTTDAEYLTTVSATSVETLRAQGGLMAPDEVAEFRRLPHWRDALTLRRADEAAKVPGRPVPGLDHWIAALMEVARRAA